MFVNIPSQITIFEGEFYKYLSEEMKTIFIAQDLWDLFQEAYEEVMTKQDSGKMPEGEDELPSRFKTVEENPMESKSLPKWIVSSRRSKKMSKKKK
ncbi:unnamed protein product [Linum tenue]|uniref:Uncharacterized protein n=1 Tax=Linum tenue TaxID=586396 RepID=A0AAV0QZQ0_9ROSI|nr:unnamed protein product [Linum tenue]